MKSNLFTEQVKAHITPELMADVKRLAAADGLSVSSWFRRVIGEHLIAKGWRPTDEERRAIFAKPRLRVVNAGSVYLIKCGDAYKIGRTRNLAQRLAGMTLPYKPRIIYVLSYSDPGMVEMTLHQMFDHCRLNGEWFALSADEVLAVKAYMAAQ